MGWESFGVIRFDLWPFFQGQMRIAKISVYILLIRIPIRIPITSLLLVLEVCSVTPTYRKSWAKNLLIWSDFTLGFSFKVK